MELYLKEFDKLNEYQKEAVKSKEKYALLNAVVGSGKTTVLVHKVLYLYFIEGVSFKDMVVLTFTNKAAGEIIKRITAFDEEFKKDIKLFGTFHSVAKQLLTDSEKLIKLGYNKDFEIIDTEKAAELLTDIISTKKFNIKYKAKLIKRIDEFKKGKKLYGVMKKDDDIDELYNIYQEEKLKRNVMDFDDLIQNCIKVLDKPLNPKYIIVDEFQDTDDTQFEMMKRIAGVDTNIFVIGDPNQIIYSWRTGTDKIFNKYINEYNPKILSLPINYRSSKTIVEAASNIINGQKIIGKADYGSPIILRKHHNAFNEAMYIARKIKTLKDSGELLRDTAVLYRRQVQGEILFDVFEKEGIKAKIVLKKSAVYEENCDDENDYVSLMTLHASKGLEFTNVFIVGANMGNIPMTSSRKDEEEELRLFFVGVTRAKKTLEISYLGKPDFTGCLSYVSPYISLIPSNLIKKEDESNNTNLKDIMKMLREEMNNNKPESETQKAIHPKYGEGIITFCNDDIIKVNFEGYGEKEFSRLFCPLDIKK